MTRTPKWMIQHIARTLRNAHYSEDQGLALGVRELALAILRHYGDGQIQATQLGLDFDMLENASDWARRHNRNPVRATRGPYVAPAPVPEPPETVFCDGGPRGDFDLKVVRGTHAVEVIPNRQPYMMVRIGDPTFEIEKRYRYVDSGHTFKNGQRIFRFTGVYG